MIISGSAYISDGDTLSIKGHRIRLRGIDTPELQQQCIREGRPYSCGFVARKMLHLMTDKKIVHCTTHGKDRYARFLGYCRTKEICLNAALVETGWAVSYGDFKIEESRAREQKRGLWSGAFENPAKWRFRQRQKAFRKPNQRQEENP